VINEWGQTHDVANLSVHDAGGFVTAGKQNPTLTIMALALRASERLADRMRKGGL
jgi:choline dehydrogenase-like flavoprotein